VMRRHPRTQFVCLHVANAENLKYVSECLDEHPNMHVDIAARIAELGRQPRAARKFFDSYQDRIVFGTDASSNANTPQQLFGDKLYQIYFRFLKPRMSTSTTPPAQKPAQGRWCIYGIGLPEPILRKVYWRTPPGCLASANLERLHDPRVLEQNQGKCIPQGLKPALFATASGTAEAVPFQSGHTNSSFALEFDLCQPFMRRVSASL